MNQRTNVEVPGWIRKVPGAVRLILISSIPRRTGSLQESEPILLPLLLLPLHLLFLHDASEHRMWPMSTIYLLGNSAP